MKKRKIKPKTQLEKIIQIIQPELLKVQSVKTIQENNSVAKDSISNRAYKNRKNVLTKQMIDRVVIKGSLWKWKGLLHGVLKKAIVDWN